jgi:hypothetical protein
MDLPYHNPTFNYAPTKRNQIYFRERCNYQFFILSYRLVFHSDKEYFNHTYPLLNLSNL